jgi:ribosomal protein L18E
MLVRLIYASYANAAMSNQDIADILKSSKINNAKLNISGILMYSNRYFFQCLEGERARVNSKYLRISTDPRHSKCVQLEFSEICKRQFTEWSMEHIEFNGTGDAVLAQYSEIGLFQPFDFTAGQAVALISELADAGAANAKSKKSLFTIFKA